MGRSLAWLKLRAQTITDVESRSCRWAHPAGNLICTYVAACEDLHVSATSGVLQEVARRKALVTALPEHLLTDKSLSEAIECTLSLHDHEAADALSVSQMQRIAAVLAPLRVCSGLGCSSDAEVQGRPGLTFAACKRVVVRHGPSRLSVLLHTLSRVLRCT